MDSNESHILAMNRPNKSFILGNGFDLDMGLPTTYAKFAESQFWPLKDEDLFLSPLAQTLQEAKDTESWFDIEDILFKYARYKEITDKDRVSRIFGSLERDKEVYHKICFALCYYIQAVQAQKSIWKDSLAARVLKAVCANGSQLIIFSPRYINPLL